MINNLDETESKKVVSLKTGETFTLSKCLNKQFCIESFGFYHESIAPNCSSSASHYHKKMDEIYYILRGQPTLVVNGKETILKQGDYVGFRGGISTSHFIKNKSGETVEFFIVCSNPDGDEVFYT